MKHKQDGFSHIGLLALLAVVAVVGASGWYVYRTSHKKDESTAIAQVAATPTGTPTPSASPTPTPPPDSPDTLASPMDVASSDGKTKFVYGAPAGQNNKKVKRIIVSLPGHGTTASDAYKAWSRHIEGGQYAVAEFDWWDGQGDETSHYYDPTDTTTQIRAFLKDQGYVATDVVILHGFSRGSSNTYAVVANDHKMGSPVIDAVISNAGKYQTNFPFFKDGSQPTIDELTEYYRGMPWVLACGGLDPNPDRDGCPGMEQTQNFLKAHQANVLGLLTDPNEGHGAFHLSSLNLPAQAFELIEAALKED